MGEEARRELGLRVSTVGSYDAKSGKGAGVRDCRVLSFEVLCCGELGYCCARDTQPLKQRGFDI